jgi:hypothetical protein
MAKTIGQLTQATTLAGGDEFIIEQSGLTKRVAASVVRGGLVNADVDAAAAIAHTKLANITAGRVLLGNASNVPTATELTGDVTVSNTGVTAIGSARVTAPMLDGAQTGSAPIYGCRAWVNFNGARNAANTGASTNGANVHIRAGGNVASVLKNGTGDYTVTFTTAMADANYAIVNGSGRSLANLHFGHLSFGSQTAGSFSVLFSRQDDGSTRADDELCMISVFR